MPFLSDVKDALDNMNAINQYFVHMHLFGLLIEIEIKLMVLSY
jgi:hypothetical protein